MQPNKSAHSTHILHYHPIWCVKYRKSLPTNQIGDRLKEIVNEIAVEENAIIEAVETDVNHVHVMLNLKPTHSIPDLVRRFQRTLGASAVLGISAPKTQALERSSLESELLHHNSRWRTARNIKNLRRITKN